MGFLPGWIRRKKLLISLPDAIETNYQLLLDDLDITGFSFADARDFRITKCDTTNTLLDHWQESVVSGITADIWVQLHKAGSSVLTSDSGIDDTLFVQDGTVFAVDDYVIICDDNHPDGEVNKITNIATNELTFETAFAVSYMTAQNAKVCHAAYIYYKNPSASSASNGTNTFEFFDDFEQAAAAEWSPYSGNPVLSPEGNEDDTDWASVWKEGSTYHMFYSYNDASDHEQVGHATSSDGKSWTKDSANNPILTHGTSGAWDDDKVWCSMVWKEDSTWYMLYSGKKVSTGAIAVGLATAPNPGGTWAKEGTNPVLEGTASEWDDGEAENWGLMKIDSTYYLWYNCFGDRKTGLATSINLTSWTKDANNPIFTGGRFCVAAFKRGSYYYLVVPHYTSGTDYSELELYRDTNPTFYSGSREFIRVVKTCPASGWDSHDEDTAFVLTTDINRNSFPSTELWCYYAGESGGVWQTGLLNETDIDAAIAMPSGESWTDNGSPTVANSILTVDGGSCKRTSQSANVSKNRALRTKARFENLSQRHWFGIMEADAATPYCLFNQKADGEQSAYTYMTENEYDVYSIATDWTIFEIQVLNADIRYLEDDVEKAASTQTYGTSEIEVAFHSWDDGKIESDWVLVRKYASPEPTTVLGEKEELLPIKSFAVVGKKVTMDIEGKRITMEIESKKMGIEIVANEFE